MAGSMESAASPPPLPVSKPYRHAKLGLVLAVCVIAACAVFVVRMQTVQRVEGSAGTKPNRMLELIARYAVGVKGLMQGTGQWNAEMTQAMLNDTKTLARNDEDALRVLILKGWMDDAWPAEAELAGIAGKSEALRKDVAALGQLKTMPGKLDVDVWKQLHQRHGWIADLAHAQTLAVADPARQAVVQQGMGTAMVLVGGMLLGMLAAVGGLVLMIMAILRWRSGKLRLTLARSSHEHGGVLMEGFAIYLTLFLLLPWLLHFLPIKLPRWAGYGPALVALIMGMTWPLVRGMQRPLWRESLGLHRGQGILREVGAGLLGWLAALPLLVLGMIAASWIMKLTGDIPSHPIVEVFAGDKWAKLGAIVLAVVWAPISEEVMFRGLLFPGLSAWVRWLLGMLLAAFVFAVIHPQGWAGVPAIMALAGTFSLLRMWRQSLIAPMMAHALNNGVMCAMMLLLW
jgi:membrane protease YdiL (CAAX protease family)